MPIIFSFILPSILPVLTTIFSLSLPILGSLINFTLTRLPKIPTYILLINILYSDVNPSTKERKLLTAGLLIIASILPFVVYSFIPWTGIPLIGAITSPIAAAIALVVALAVLDLIFTINKGYYLDRLKKKGFAGLNDIEADINALKAIFGKSWQKVGSTINNATQKIYREVNEREINFGKQSFEDFIEHELEALNIYVGKTSITDYQSINQHLLKQNNSNAWIHSTLSFGASASVGTLAGIGTSTIASSVLVPASIWTTIQSFLGISTGIVVTAPIYSLLTFFTPLGLGVGAGLGIYASLMDSKAKEQAAEMSKFLSEIIIAALPMAWIDGTLADSERDLIDGMMTTAGLRKQERDLVRKAIIKRQSFDEIIQTSILFDDEHRKKTCTQSINERLKHRLILFMAWKIAIADGQIYESELQLHNRMADKLGISREEIKEIRRVLELQYRGELVEVTFVSQSNGSKAKLLKNVREQHRLQSTADNL